MAALATNRRPGNTLLEEMVFSRPAGGAPDLIDPVSNASGPSVWGRLRALDRARARFA